VCVQYRVTRLVTCCEAVMLGIVDYPQLEFSYVPNYHQRFEGNKTVRFATRGLSYISMIT